MQVKETHKCPHCDIPVSFSIAESLKKASHSSASKHVFCWQSMWNIIKDLGPLQANFRDNNIENSYGCSQCIMSFSQIKELKKHVKSHPEESFYKSTSDPSVLNYWPRLRVSNNMWHYMLMWNRIYVIFVQNLLLRRVHFSLTCKFIKESCQIISHYVQNLQVRDMHGRFIWESALARQSHNSVHIVRNLSCQ